MPIKKKKIDIKSLIKSKKTCFFKALFVLLLFCSSIFISTQIVEFKQEQHNEKISYLESIITKQSKKIINLESQNKNIKNNEQGILELNASTNLLNEKLINLKNEVGNRQLEILKAKLENLNHRIEIVEESKNKESLILSLALIIKENSSFGRSFSDEAKILVELSKNFLEIAPQVTSINKLSKLDIKSNNQLVDEYNAVIKNFAFNTATDVEKSDTLVEKDMITKTVEIIKDTISGINFDKIVVLNKDSNTAKQKLLLTELNSLIKDYNFKEAFNLIKQNKDFTNAQNSEFNNWVDSLQNRIKFDEDLSFIISNQLSAIKLDLSSITKD